MRGYEGVSLPHVMYIEDREALLSCLPDAEEDVRDYASTILAESAMSQGNARWIAFGYATQMVMALSRMETGSVLVVAFAIEDVTTDEIVVDENSREPDPDLFYAGVAMRVRSPIADEDVFQMMLDEQHRVDD